MTFVEFSNGLRVLLNIDFAEFATCLGEGDHAAEEEWPHFRENPYRYFIAADDAVAQRLFAIIHERNAGTRARAGVSA